MARAPTLSGAAAAVLFLAITSAEAQERLVRVSEGTNFAVAATAGGAALVIDLQGTLWRLPPSGGEAEAITDGLGDDRLPDLHPGGERIVYQSYRGGTWDIWTVDLAGGAPRQLTTSGFDDREPAWSPDGSRIAFSSDRAGSYDLWLLDPDSGETTRLTAGLANESQPAWLPDGNGLVFVSMPEGAAEGAVHRIPATGGESVPIPGTEGRIAAPSVNPSGDVVLFRRFEPGAPGRPESRAALHLAPLGTADDAPEPEARELAGAGTDIFPFPARWTDPETVLYTADGVIRRLRVGAGAPETVPMTVAFPVLPAPERTGRIRTEATGPQPVRGLIRPSISPDGTRLVYAALGDLWTAPLDGSEAPLPLTRDTWLDTDPVWTPDGAAVVFASDRGGTMDLWEKRVDSAPGLGLTQLTARIGAELSPAVSPDGARIAWLDEVGNLRTSGRDLTAGPHDEPEAATLFAGRFRLAMPSWSADGTTIAVATLAPWSSRFREGRNRIAMVAADTGEARLLEEPGGSVGSRDSDGPVFSPDGTHLAFALDGGLAVLPLAPDGTAAGPPRRVFEGPVDFPAWSPDGGAITVVSGTRLLRVAADGSGAREIPVRHEFRPSDPAGRLLFRDASVLDVAAGAVRRGLDVLVEGGRIVSVSPTGEPPPEDLRIVATEGATLMPGLIEMHTHPASPGFGSRFGRLHLAYGVTSVRIPAAGPYRVVEERESILAGRRVGPRVFLTGSPLDGDRIYYPGALPTPGGPAFEAAFAMARDLDYDVVKTYVRLDDALQRDAIRRAHRMGAFVTSHELYPAVRHGVDGIEHIQGTSRRGFSPKVTDLGHSYEDVRALIHESGAYFTPTLLIYGGWNLALAREPGLLAADRRIHAFPAWAAGWMLAARPADDAAVRLAVMRPKWDTVAEIARRGGRVVAGTDTPIIPYGLGLIIEIEQLAEAGLGPAGAIRAATLTAAAGLGLEGELGVVAEGALADLVVVEGNPLEDIRNLRRVRAVVWNGRLATLDQLLGF